MKCDEKRNHIMSLFNGATSESTLKVTIPESFQTESSHLKNLELKYTTEPSLQEVLPYQNPTYASPNYTQADLCRPWNYEDFLYRLHSFQYNSGQWFAKPQCISPLECSLYGWINCGVDKITCNSCSAELHHNSADDINGDILKGLLWMGHESSCSWRQLEKGCDRSFIDIPHIQSARELNNNILLNIELILSHINSVEIFGHGISSVTYTFRIPEIMVDQNLINGLLSDLKTMSITIKKDHKINELIEIIKEVRAIRSNAIKAIENNINVYSNESITSFSQIGNIIKNSDINPTSFTFLMNFVKSHYYESESCNELIDVLKFAIIVAECGWITSKVATSTNNTCNEMDDKKEIDISNKLLALHCTLCGRSVSLERYKYISSETETSESPSSKLLLEAQLEAQFGRQFGLDLIAQHRPYCPWINTPSVRIPTWLQYDDTLCLEQKQDLTANLSSLPNLNVPAWYINLAAFAQYSDPTIINLAKSNFIVSNESNNTSDVVISNASTIEKHSLNSHTFNYNINNKIINHNEDDDNVGNGSSINPEQTYKRIRSILNSASSQ